MSVTKRRNRGGWSRKSEAYLAQVQAVVDGLHEYWPLTLRQVYYQLVAAGTIENKPTQYHKLSRILTKARLDGLVPWKAIEDRARSRLSSAGWADAEAFVADETDRFLEGYRRDLLQGQDYALELWTEKDALSGICHRAAVDYCVSVVVARGFSSVSFVHEARNRIEARARAGQRTILLYFGDLDPSGWEMLPAMLETLQHEMGLGDLVQGVRCALTPDQVSEFRLPRNPDALKSTDPRARKYTARFGDLAVELDALPPAELETLVRQSIEQNLDLFHFEAEQARQAEERERITELQTKVREVIEAHDSP